MEWIDSKKKLPTTNERVVVNLIIAGVQLIDCARYEKEFERFRAIDGMCYDTEVTHWMLPEPPKS